MIYDRSVYELMKEGATSLTPPFTVPAIVAWFGERYPKIKYNTITAHIHGMTSNDPNRHHYSTGAKPPLFFRTAAGALVRFDPDLHEGETQDLVESDDDADLGVNGGPGDISPQAAQFVLEAQLETFLLSNWHAIEWGRPLKILTTRNGEKGNQFKTSVGILDFLCFDTASDALVVVELKRGRPSDKVVGQIARYIGYIKAHVAKPGQPVEGLIVAHETDDELRYAVSAMPGLALATYEVAFALRPVATPLTATGAVG